MSKKDKDIVITSEEVEAMLAASDLSSLGLVDSELIAFFVEEINSALFEADAVLFESLREALTGAASQEALSAARELIGREASTFVANFAETEMKKLGDIIAKGIEEGLGPKQIARNIDNVKGLDKNRAATYFKRVSELEEIEPPLSAAQLEKRSEAIYNKLLQDRKEVIARTEQRFATEKANEVQALENGKEFKAWLTVGDSRVSNECEANESDGWIPIDEVFDSGHDHPPEHPRCRCTLTYRKIVTDAAKQRQENRSASTAASKLTEVSV